MDFIEIASKKITKELENKNFISDMLFENQQDYLFRSPSSSLFILFQKAQKYCLIKWLFSHFLGANPNIVDSRK